MTAGASGQILVASDTEKRASFYTVALAAAGVPERAMRVVTPFSGIPPRDLAASARAVVLCGGLDIHPERYGEAIRPHARIELDVERDEMEWDLLELAQERRLPVWGVCRGLQVLNVYFGGSLWQDLPTQLPSQIDHSQSKTLDLLAHTLQVIEPEAPLGELLTRDIPLVNSRHHQAIKRTAEGFVPVALSPDGLIEATVLDRGDWWVRAVQWHPENLIDLAQQRALWIDFARAAGFEVG
ncbi:MAG TPA: gamma-glutamyl-gamma-aminobutyrate hydrolase family protein [Thermoanaerobaculia bacterium]|jgi:putative glutamine amidotransferase|nr:gamma-glutamyl-gamma-aminobutyrate hydrolase family protein [Thermoanaerobaculia bacterium]